MRQTWALLIDAYRDLNARKMFWIVLIISGLVAISMAMVGLTMRGFTVFGYEIKSPFLNAREMTPAEFYKLMFLTLGIQWWLTQFATALALISTASIFPDFLMGGSVDLYLSKPIGRWRLFWTKYACGLLFVTLQIACFSLASFLVIGLRGGAWEPALFLAVPIVVLFYSYLYCVCVLIGVVTRSTVAAVLLTLLFWLCVFSVHTTEVTLLLFKIHGERAHKNVIEQIDRDRTALAEIPAATTPSYRQVLLENQLKRDIKERDDYYPEFDRPHEWFYAMKIFLPKTSETVYLLQRELVSRASLSRDRRTAEEENDSEQATAQSGGEVSRGDVGELQKQLGHRSWVWITGTSLGFEAAVLLLAGWIFCRRDY
ncbi:MAG: hypothetical protein ABSF29_13765 [Tepidisphaeraceae bacterium]